MTDRPAPGYTPARGEAKFPDLTLPSGVGRGLRWWQQDGCVADRRRRSAFATGCCASTPAEDGLVDGKSPGAPSKLNADHRRALAEVVEAGPVPAVDGVVRWPQGLARWLLETFAISLDETTVGRELKALGFAKISARPRHAQNELAGRGFKKNFPAELAKIRARLPKGVEIELWWQDEARIGQKNKLTRMGQTWHAPARPATSAPNGPISSARSVPRRGKAPGWSCGATPTPWRRTFEISAAVDPGAHAVLIVDQAGWH